MPLDATSLSASDFGLTPAAPSDGAAMGAPSLPLIAPHPAPDGSGGMTNLSDADYATFQQQRAAPPVATPTTPGNPAATSTAPSRGGAQSGVQDWRAGLSASQFGLAAAPSGPAPPPTAAPVAQMTGLGRQLALPASNFAKGLIGAAGTPGDIIRGVGAIGGAQAAASLQGNPLPTAAPTGTPSPFAQQAGGPAQMFTPQELAGAPGKAQITPPSFNTPISSESLLRLSQDAGLTDRPDLQPQNARERMEAAATQGVGMVVPQFLTGSVSSIPAALRLARAGAGIGIGSEYGGDAGQAVGGTPGRVIGSLAGSLAPSLAGAGGAALYDKFGPALEAALPVTRGMQARVAARSFAAANLTPAQRAALANPPELVPGSPGTSYQVTGSPFLGAQEKSVANRPQYKPMFDAVRQQQNAAQVAALNAQQPAQGDIDAIVPWFQGRLQQMRDAEEAETGAARATTQAAVDSAGNIVAPHEAGATVRRSVENERAPAVAASDAAIGQAQGAAQQETEALGGAPSENAAQEHGARMRGEWPSSGLLGTKAADKAKATRLYDAVDPERKLVVGGLRPVSETAALLAGGKPRGAMSVLLPERASYLSEIGAAGRADLAPGEAKALEFAADLGNIAKFSDLRKLQRMTAAAQRDIGSNVTLGRESQPYLRMRELRKATDEAMARAARDTAARDPEVAQQLSLLARDELDGLAAGRRLPAPPSQPGPDLLGRITPPPAVAPQQEPMIRTDVRQATMPGAMGAAETAGVDAGRMNDDLLAQWKPGDVDSAANVPFVRAFVRDVPDAAERGKFYTADGNLSLEGAQRIRNAMLMRAYGDLRLVSALAETGDENIKAFGGALSDAAGDMARLRSDIAGGRADAAIDISPNLLDAARLVGQARRRGISIANMVGQSDMLSGRTDPLTLAVLRAAYGSGLNGRINRAKMAELLSYYANEASKQTTAPRLFGANLGPNEILAQGVARAGSEPAIRTTDVTGRTAGVDGYGESVGPNGNQARRVGSGAAGQADAGGGLPAAQGATEAVTPGLPTGATQAPLPPTREPAVVQFGSRGMPGAEQPDLGGAPLVPNFTAEDATALRRANANYADYKARHGRGAVGDVLARSERTPSGFRVPDSAVPAKLFAKGAAGAEAADSLIAATRSRDAALHVLGEYPAYSLRAAAEDMGTLSLPKYQKWMADHAAVLDKFPELRASFDTAAKARAVLDDLKAQRAAIDAANPIRPGWGDADIMQRFVQPGPKGYEAAGKLVVATGGRPEAIAATRDYLASSLRDAAEVKSGTLAGTLDRVGYERWMKNYASFLSHPAMADARAAFENAGTAQAQLDASAAAHRVAQDAYQRSVARHFLPDDTDPVTAIGHILESQTAGPQMADLARQTASDPVARQAVQAAAMRYMMRRVTSNNLSGADLDAVTLKNNQAQEFINRHVNGTKGEGALRHILTPDQLKALDNVRLDLRRANMAVVGPRNTEGSHTGLLRAGAENDAHRPSLVGSLAIMESLGEAGQEALGKWGRVASMLLVPVMNWARTHGYANINDLRAAALADPRNMSALLDKLPSEAGVPSRIAAIKAQVLSAEDRQEAIGTTLAARSISVPPITIAHISAATSAPARANNRQRNAAP